LPESTLSDIKKYFKKIHFLKILKAIKENPIESEQKWL